MAAYYDSIKSMKTAKVGTILPWAGDGGTGFLASNIPKGWIVCDGDVKEAKLYPLLASILGDTYGGDMTRPAGGHYTFPYVDEQDGSNNATFRLPELSGNVMVDLENNFLDQTKYQFDQPDVKTVVVDDQGTKLGDLVKDYGETTKIKASWSADADIDFTLSLSGNLYFKFTNFTLTAPDFLESVYTLNRKLGLNHTPSHSHTDSIPTAQVGGRGPMVFSSGEEVAMSGSQGWSNNCSGSFGPFNCNISTSPLSWRDGHAKLAYYGNSQYEQTLPQTNIFREFVVDTVNAGKNYWDTVPAGATNWRGSTRGSGPAQETYTQTIQPADATTLISNTTPLDTHAQPAFKGMFPRPMEDNAKANFYGHSPKGTTKPVRADGLNDSPEERTAYNVPGCTVTEGSNKILLPVGTDLTQQYGSGSDTWSQWDQIRPTMYVTAQNPDEKYKYFEEGIQVLRIDWNASATNTAATGQYEITVNKNAGQGEVTTAAGWSTGTIGLKFRDGTYATSLNSREKDPLQQNFRGHNHGSFEIAQTIGTMTGPPSHTADNADGSSLAADSIENGLNIAVETAQPSLTMTFIIKAY